MRKNTSGFTLVELLIVIVIIAILAAITIVAYNGVQQRAVNSQVLAAVSTYKKGLILYYGDNSAWPTPSANMVCLGQPAGGTCRGGTWSENAALDAALVTELGNNLPQVTKNSINDTASPANPVLGYVAPASNVTYNGTAVPWIIYTLSPGSSCGLTVASGA